MGSHTGVLGFSPRSRIFLTRSLQNAYYTELGLDPCPLMVPDLMHDVELGLERHKQLHDLRILHAVGKGAVQEFDARSVPFKAVAHSLL